MIPICGPKEGPGVPPTWTSVGCMASGSPRSAAAPCAGRTMSASRPGLLLKRHPTSGTESGNTSPPRQLPLRPPEPLPPPRLSGGGDGPDGPLPGTVLAAYRRFRGAPGHAAFWPPCPLLEELAAAGKSFRDYAQGRAQRSMGGGRPRGRLWWGSGDRSRPRQSFPSSHTYTYHELFSRTEFIWISTSNTFPDQ